MGKTRSTSKSSHVLRSGSSSHPGMKTKKKRGRRDVDGTPVAIHQRPAWDSSLGPPRSPRTAAEAAKAASGEEKRRKSWFVAARRRISTDELFEGEMNPELGRSRTRTESKTRQVKKRKRTKRGIRARRAAREAREKAEEEARQRGDGVPGGRGAAAEGMIPIDPAKFKARVEYEAAMRARDFGSVDIISGRKDGAFGVELSDIHGHQMAFVREAMEKQRYLTDSSGVRVALDANFVPEPGLEPQIQKMPRSRPEAAKGLDSKRAARALQQDIPDIEEDNVGPKLSLTGRQLHLMAEDVAMDSSQIRAVLGGQSVRTSDNRFLRAEEGPIHVDATATGFRQLSMIESGRIYDSSQMKGILEASATKDPSIFRTGDAKRVLLDGEHAKQLDLVKDQHFFKSDNIKKVIAGKQLSEGEREVSGITSISPKRKVPSSKASPSSPDGRLIASQLRYFTDPEEFRSRYARRVAHHQTLVTPTGADQALQTSQNLSAGISSEKLSMSVANRFGKRHSSLYQSSEGVSTALHPPPISASPPQPPQPPQPPKIPSNPPTSSSSSPPFLNHSRRRPAQAVATPPFDPPSHRPSRSRHYDRTLRESDAWSPTQSSYDPPKDRWQTVANLSQSPSFHSSPPWSEGSRSSKGKAHVLPPSGSPYQTTIPGGRFQ